MVPTVYNSVCCSERFFCGRVGFVAFSFTRSETVCFYGRVGFVAFSFARSETVCFYVWGLLKISRLLMILVLNTI